MTDVVAALIQKGERFLICQRPAHKARGLLWEFVGGKVEEGETEQQALVRECREELAVLVDVGKELARVVYHYPDLTVRLTLFSCTLKEGAPRLLEHNALRWITHSELDGYTFCPADRELLKKLREKEER